MESIPEDPRTITEIRRVLSQVAKRVNGLSNFRISRSGNTDSIKIGPRFTVMNLRRIRASGAGANAGSVDGYHVELAGQNTSFIPDDYAMDGYDPETHDNWSLRFTVSGGTLDAVDVSQDENGDWSGTNPVGTSDIGTAGENQDRFDGDASTDPETDQTYCQIPIVRDGRRVSHGGAFRENGFCAGSRGQIAELIGIG